MQVRCPKCDERVRVSDSSRKAKCRNCGLGFYPEDDDEPSPRKKPNELILPLAIVGGVFALVAVIGIVVWASSSRKAKDDEPEQAVALPPREQRNPAPQNPPRPRPAFPQDNQPEPNPPPTVQPKIPPPPKIEEPVEKPIAWQARPDPLATPVVLPDPISGSIPLPQFSSSVVKFPDLPSPFISVQLGSNATDPHEVWDLRTMKKVGSVSGRVRTESWALSPDGQFIAAEQILPSAKVAELTVWSVADGSVVATIPLVSKYTNNVDITFAGPDRLLYGSQSGTIDYSYHLWNVKTKSELHEFPKSTRSLKPLRAVSPGGRYAVLPKKDLFDVMDLTTGRLAGIVKIPAPTGYSTTEGIAFSSDGSKLGVLYHHDRKNKLAVFDMTNGRVAAEHTFPPEHELSTRSSFGVPALEGLPGGNWLLFGSSIADAKSGEVYWTFPRDAIPSGSPIRFFDKNRLAQAEKDAKLRRSLRIVTLPADELTPGKTETAGRPAPKPADWSGVIKSPPPGGDAKWEAPLDPAPAAKAKLAVQPIALLGKPIDFSRFAFSSSDAAQAAIVSGKSANQPGTRKSVSVDRYDLIGGKHLGSNVLFTCDAKAGQSLQLKADLSPSGKHILIVDPDGKRVDVWDLAGNRHVAGLEPYEKPVAKPNLHAAFASESRMFTVADRRLVMWEIATGKAIWSAEGVSGIPALSPGRKQIAACAGNRFAILDVESGLRLGTLAGPEITTAGNAAFRPDGKQFVALAQVGTKSELLRWELTEGTFAKSSTTLYTNLQIGWAGNEHVMLEGTLVHLETGWPLINYQAGGMLLAGVGPDGRLWYIPTESGSGSLTAATVPDAAAKDVVRAISNRSVQTVLAPGTKVSLVVQAGDAGAQTRATEMLTSMLQSHGLDVGSGGSVTLTARMSVRSTGASRQYSGPGGAVTVPIDEVECVVTLSDARGTILEQKGKHTTPEPVIIRTRQEELIATLQQQLWGSALTTVMTFRPPLVVLRGASGLQPLPMPGSLVGNRK